MERGDLARQILFPNVEGFRPPDRMLPGIYRSVAERLEKGMTITQATASGDSAFSELAGKSEDYNTRYGGYIGYVQAWEVVKLVPRAPAEFSLAAMLDQADVSSADEAVVYLSERFLSAQPSEEASRELVRFARRVLERGEERNRFGKEDERSLRELLHLILSLPEYQVA